MSDGIEGVSKKANQWLTVRNFNSTEIAIATANTEGREIWVTHLHAGVSVPLQKPLKIPNLVALVIGAEHDGASDQML